VLVVWSGTKPRYDTHRIPPEGLVLGRDLADPGDDRISRAHARIMATAGKLLVTDLGSRNGTFVHGTAIAQTVEAVGFPAVIRTGRTISLLVPDVRLYEHVPITRRGTLVLGGSLELTARAVDSAAIAADNLTLAGPMNVGVALARSYAAALGGTVLSYRPIAGLAEAIAGTTSLRTVILELGMSRLGTADTDTLAELLETDVRIVSCVHSGIDLRGLPKDISPRLTTRVIEIPERRFDDLPATLADIFAEMAPTGTMHYSAITQALEALRIIDEDMLLDRFRIAVTVWRRGGGTELRGEDIENDLLNRHPESFCVVGDLPQRGV
jgi:hypothetical protein